MSLARVWLPVALVAMVTIHLTSPIARHAGLSAGIPLGSEPLATRPVQFNLRDSGMGHELTPKTDRPALSTAEIIRRLQVSFVHVDEKISIDYESGMHEEVSRELRARLVQILDDRIGLVGLIGRRMAPLAVVAFRTR